MIAAVIERCAGIDIGKTFLVACVMVGPADGEPRTEQRTYGTTNADLAKLLEWLLEERCTHVALESTGSYWKPVFNILENRLTVVLANPEDVKARKGHKTDPKDSWWLAHLLRHAMIRPSFIPPLALRELRDLTRRRKRLLQHGTSERNRIQKVLEDANVKLGNVLCDLFGASGQLMLHALLEGQAAPEEIAQFAKGRAKSKIPELVSALEGHRMSDHHRQMVRFSLEHLVFLERQIEVIDEEIRRKILTSGMQQAFELLQTVPGVKADAAAGILAEVGPDMQVFPSAGHLSSWTGVCPGNQCRAGKKKGSSTTKGNRWLRGLLIECAWAATSKKDCYLNGKFWRLAAAGKKKAIVAIAHTLLVVIYHVLSQSKPYQERGRPPIEEHQRQRLIRHHIRALGRLGISAGYAL
jgi:transposase